MSGVRKRIEKNMNFVAVLLAAAVSLYCLVVVLVVWSVPAVAAAVEEVAADEEVSCF